MRIRVVAYVAGAGLAAIACGDLIGLGDPPLVVVIDPDASDAMGTGVVEDSTAPRDAGADDPVADAGLADDETSREGSEPSNAKDATIPPSLDASDESFDGSADRTFLATSCLDIRRNIADAGTGRYTIAIDGNPLDVYCDMDLDDGGWTAFFVDHIGSGNVVGEFELNELGLLVDTCPDPSASCLHHLPDTVSVANDFAVVCGKNAIRFTVPQTVLQYWQNGFESGWQQLVAPMAIAGANTDVLFATHIYTGNMNPPDNGWIVAGVEMTDVTTFASAHPAGGFDWCNGVDYSGVDANAVTPMVWLLYR